MTVEAPPEPTRGGGPRPASGAPGGLATAGRRAPWRRWVPSWPVLALAALTYLPLLATSPGRIGADTKAYLYLDPGRMLSRAVSMWDPHVGAGTVTHQNIGYLFPQGLFYWVLDTVGLPDWVAQRLWTASILFAAGTGVLFLLRSLTWPAGSRPGPGEPSGPPEPSGTAMARPAGLRHPANRFGLPDRFAFIAAAGYTLTPYVLEYEARISAILLPYAGLGWLVGITMRGVREAGHVPVHLGRRRGLAGWKLPGWRWPILFALLVTSIGSINASSLIFILLAPLLWIPFAVWGTREVDVPAALGVCARATIAVLLTSAWWIAGLYTQAGYGLNVLAFTETVKTVASSSQASEVLRGLGNWFFYGEDALGAWISPAQGYTRALWLIAVSFAVPVLALAASSCLRWGYKAYFVCLILLGTIVSVGVYPYDDPSPLGRLFRDFAEGSTAGLALRSLPRAVPMVVLGLSVLLAVGLSALAQTYAARRATGTAATGATTPGLAGTAGMPPRRGRRPGGGRALRGRRADWVPAAATATVLALLLLDATPLFAGQFVEERLDRGEQVPSYEIDAARALDAGDDATRVLELPGADFAHYRWGATLDPVATGLTERAHLVRELIPYGEAGTVDLLRAIDRRLQEGVLEPEAVPDLARLLGVGEVLLRNNIQYERFRSPRPRAAWDLFTAKPPPGLSEPRPFGPPATEDNPIIPFTDEMTLGTDSLPDPPALAVFDVSDPLPIVRTATTASPLLVDGSGEALVDAAATGLLRDVTGASRAVLYTAAMADDPDALEVALADGATLLVTDTNRRRAERWTGVRENFGYTEQVGVEPLERDPNDNRLPLFPAADATHQTVALLHAPGTVPDVDAVRATSYGNSFAYSPADRPVRAIDGDATTAWRVGAFTDPIGERWQGTLAEPTTTDRIRLIQPITGPRNRWITQATLRFDGGPPVTIGLDSSSRTPAGQVVRFPNRTFEQLEISVDATNHGRRKSYDGASAVGFAEIEIPAADGLPVVADEVLRMPTSLLDTAGTQSHQHPLLLQIARDRANPAEPFKLDTESVMARTFDLPTARTFDLAGTARLSAYTSDDHLDTVLGRPATAAVTSSSGRLPGTIAARSSGAFDGDRTTSWSPGFGTQVGSWIQTSSPFGPVTFSSLALSVVADGRHSVPTKIGIEVDGLRVQTLAIPPVTRGPRPPADGSTGAGAAPEADSDMIDATLTFPPTRGRTVKLVIDEIKPVTTTDTISNSELTLPVAIAEVGIPGLYTAPPPATLPAPCRHNLLTIDGNPIGVQVTGSSEDAVDRRGLELRLCGNPLPLGAGPHVIRTTDGRDTGIDIDRLVLASAAGGGPGTVGGTTTADGTASGTATTPGITAPGTTTPGTTTPGTTTPGTTTPGTTAPGTTTPGSATGLATTPGPALPAPVPATAPVGVPDLAVTEGGDTAYTVEVTGARPGTPFWLVLGQSLSPGWSATVAGADAGAPVLVDGYANGWRVTPTTANFTIELRWTPQRVVWVALAVSTVAIVVSLVLLALAWRTARRGPAGGRDPGGRQRPAPVEPPALERPWAPGPTLHWRRAAPVAIAAGIAATVLVNPATGLVVAAAALLALTRRRGRLLLRVGPAACLAASALYVLQVQFRHDLPTTGSWVSEFEKVAALSWLAVLLLVTDVVVTAATRRRGGLPSPRPRPTTPP